MGRHEQGCKCNSWSLRQPRYMQPLRAVHSGGQEQRQAVWLWRHSFFFWTRSRSRDAVFLTLLGPESERATQWIFSFVFLLCICAKHCTLQYGLRLVSVGALPSGQALGMIDRR